MKVLMVHEVEPWMFDLDLSSFDLITFDDGLYSQFFYRSEFLKLNIPLKYFISTNIISTGKQSLEFPSCSESHKRFFESGDTSNYMTWEQITELHNTRNCTIGGHSHSHLKYEDIKLRELHNLLIEDNNSMFAEFHQRQIVIRDYCHPYNIVVPLRTGMLEAAGVVNFYGSERIAIEDLK